MARKAYEGARSVLPVLQETEYLVQGGAVRRHLKRLYFKYRLVVTTDLKQESEDKRG